MQFILHSVLFLSLFFKTTVGSKDWIRIQQNKGGSIFWDANKEIRIKCYENVEINKFLSLPIPIPILIDNIVIEKCILPPIPIIDTLKTLNMNVKTLKVLYLHGLNPLLPGNYTRDLNIQELRIENVQENFFHNVQNEFFGQLKHLDRFVVLATEMLLSLPYIDHAYKLVLSSSWIRNWDNCQNLQKLLLMNLNNIPTNITLNCPRLNDIEIRSTNSIDLENLLESLRPNWENLVSLTLNDLKLSLPPLEILRVAKNLTVLDLEQNSLSDKSFSNFPLMSNLIELRLENNMITGYGLPDLLQQVPNLKKLILNKNNITCGSHPYINMRAVAEKSISVEILSLGENDINLTHCFKNVSFPRLERLSLVSLKRSHYFRLQDLPRTNSRILKVYLMEEQQNIIFGYQEYLSLNHTGSLSEIWGSNADLMLLMNAIECNCEHYWLWRALQDFPNQISIPYIHCKSSIKTPHISVAFQKMTCNDTDTFLRYDLTVNGSNVILDVNDSGDVWKKIAKLHYPITSVKLFGNGNVTMDNFTLSETVLDLDLKNNGLSLGMSEMALLFQVPERKLFLYGNKFICDCEHKPLLDSMYQHRNQVMDYIQLRCMDNTPVYTVSLEICVLRYPLAFSSAALFLALVVAIILWRYRLQVKIYLYYHGWFVSFLKEEDLDADRPYDAFLSFAHGDDEYVMQELLPKLEIEPYQYRICVHYRDWVVGDWIPRQVSRSVHLSKRTIIVLSKNFAKSLWGCLEFRYAVAGAVKDGRSRLIVLVLDDVLNEPLNEEIQSYLSMNTYMCCHDPWFWQKLHYAMPRSKSFVEKRASTPEPPLEMLMEPLPQ